MPVALLFVLLSFAVYRITRFVVLDSMIEEWRDSFYGWLLSPLDEELRRQVLSFDQTYPLEELSWWRRKAYTLLNCPFCVSAYVAAGVVATQHFFVEPLPVPAWWWLGTWTGGLVVYAYIDSDE